MNLAEYSSCDGVALADLVRKGEVSPKELVHLFAEAVEKINPKINAVIEVYSDRIGFWLMRTIAENQAEGKGEDVLVALFPLSALFIAIPFVYTEKSPRLRT